MKMFLSRPLIVALLLVIGGTLALAGCNPDANQSEAANQDCQWPENVHIAAPGQSGLAKYVSWASIMEADTGMAIRVVP